MSDWADKRAMALFTEYGDDVGIMDVAAALRSARNEALEEAASLRKKSIVPFGEYYISATAIRALKDKAA